MFLLVRCLTLRQIELLSRLTFVNTFLTKGELSGGDYIALALKRKRRLLSRI